MSDPRGKSPGAGSVTGIGAVVFASSIGLMFLPAIVPLGSGAKYLVAGAFIGAIAGLSILLNGMIDWWRSRDRT